jgi:hypothetical protein
MLAGDDVVDGKGEEGIVVLVNPTVLAAIACAFADERSQRPVHQL